MAWQPSPRENNFYSQQQGGGQNYGEQSPYSGQARDPYTEPDSQGGRYPQQPGEGQNYGEQSPYTGQARDPYSGQGWQGERDPQQQGGEQNYEEQSPYSGQDYNENPFQKTDQSTSVPLTDKSIRMGFIRKIYAIVTVQIAITTLIVVLFQQYPSLKEVTPENFSIVFVSFCMLIIATIVMFCLPNLLRLFPINLILLFIFTCLWGAILGYICIFFEPDIVISALGMTAIICFSLTVFAFQTSIDYTGLSPYIFVILATFSMIVFRMLFFAPMKSVRIACAAAGVLLYSILLVRDTQLMLGGNHRNSYSPEDYVYAALSIYLDFSSIFLEVLSFLYEIGSNRRR